MQENKDEGLVCTKIFRLEIDRLKSKLVGPNQDKFHREYGKFETAIANSDMQRLLVTTEEGWLLLYDVNKLQPMMRQKSVDQPQIEEM